VLDGSSVASGSASGSLHVWRVEYSSKPGGWAPDKYRGMDCLCSACRKWCNSVVMLYVVLMQAFAGIMVIRQLSQQPP
jgi:hypothetical protein